MRQLAIVLLALLATRIAFAVGIKDGHRMIFSDERESKQKLASFLECKYLLA